MSKRKKPAPRMKAIKPVAPLSLPPAPEPEPENLELGGFDYIFTDIWAEDTYRSQYPQGYRGYIVLSIGDVWARLFSPVSLDYHKVKIDDFDKLVLWENMPFNREEMLPRLRARRALARKYGMFDGGLAANAAETLCHLQV